MMVRLLSPFALSLSKGGSSLSWRSPKEGQGFDELSPNGFGPKANWPSVPGGEA